MPSGASVKAVEASDSSLAVAIPPATTTSTSTSGATSIGELASTITSDFSGLTTIITAGSYLAGLAFATASIAKFKTHKDNPTQIPIGTPIAMLFIAAALLFIPTIETVASETTT